MLETFIHWPSAHIEQYIRKFDSLLTFLLITLPVGFIFLTGFIPCLYSKRKGRRSMFTKLGPSSWIACLLQGGKDQNVIKIP